MKVKELQAVLAKMEPDAEFDNCKAFFDIAKESDVQDFENALECLGYKTEEISRDKLSLKGLHNLYNSMAAALSASILDIKKDAIRKALADFQSVYNNVVCDVAEENNLEVE